MANLSTVKTLAVLNISDNKGLAYLVNLEHLYCLHANNIFATNESTNLLVQMPSLQIAYLKNNEIRNSGLEVFFTEKYSLYSLDLSFNPVTQSAINEVKNKTHLLIYANGVALKHLQPMPSRSNEVVEMMKRHINRH